VGGAAVGGLLALLGSWWQEQRRWAREDRLRWGPARFDAYSRFIEAASLTHDRVFQFMVSFKKNKDRQAFAGSNKELAQPSQEEVEERRHDFENSLSSLTKALAEIDLIGSGATRESAHAVQNAIAEMVSLARRYRLDQLNDLWSRMG
jgi:hypothetical protein